MIAFLVAGLTFFSTLIGGLAALKFKDKLHLILAFAAGAVVATALLEILPLVRFPILSAIGFLFFHLLARLGKGEHLGTISAGGFSIHSFFDGLGIGLGFLTSFQLGLVISLAVLAHDFSDGLNTTTVILRNNGNTAKAILWLVVVAATPLLGVLASTMIPSSRYLLPYVLSFYFGFFLYLGASDLLPEAHHRHSSTLTTLATVVGFGVIYFLTRITL